MLVAYFWVCPSKKNLVMYFDVLNHKLLDSVVSMFGRCAANDFWYFGGSKSGYVKSNVNVVELLLRI